MLQRSPHEHQQQVKIIEKSPFSTHSNAILASLRTAAFKHIVWPKILGSVSLLK